MTWTRLPLKEVVSLRRGFDLPKQHRKEGNVPILSAGEVQGTHDEARVSGPGFAIGRVTNLGKPQWSEVDFWPLNTTLYAEDFHGNSPRWLYHLFQVLRLDGYDSGSVQPTLNRNYIADVSVEVPPRHVQDAIAEVLGALDDRIAANKAVVELCDQLRHTYWKQLTTKATTEQPLSELAQFVNGRAFTKNADGKGRMVVRIAELNTGPGASTVYSSIDAPENHTVSAGELLMSWSGSLRTARWFRDDAIVNQHIFKVIPTAPDTEWAVESAIDTLMPTFRSIAADKATTMGHIKREHLDFKVRWPRLTGGQQALGASVWRRALQAEVENEVLARTRDELLPLLMNGTITVREAEDRTKEVP